MQLLTNLVIAATWLAIGCLGCSAPKQSSGSSDQTSASIGTRYYILEDSSRADPVYGDNRLVNVQVWYPSRLKDPSAHLRQASYLPQIEHLWFQIDGWTRSNAELAATARTNGLVGAPLKKGSDKLPIVLFTPCLGAHSSYYTYYAEEFARRGFFVIGINHLHESAFIIDRGGQLHPSDHSYYEILRTVKVPEEISAEELVAAREERVKILAFDLMFVLTQFSYINTNEFGSRMDFNKVGVWGHGIGGAASLYAAVFDSRLKAIVNVDGEPPVVAVNEGIDPPFLHIQHADPDDEPNRGSPVNDTSWTSLCEKSRSDAFRVYLPQTDGKHFHDLAYWLAPPGGRTDPKSYMEDYLHYMVPFFANYLLGQQSSIPSGPTSSAEILVYKQ